MPTRAVEKASNRAERQLIEGMIASTYPSGSALPGERDLCKQLGVARPALREALQRLARDGWLDIQQGKPTQVNGFMRDGNLNVLISLLQVDITLLPDFVPNLLEIWSLLAPGYAAEAIARQPQEVARLLYGFRGLADRPGPFARAQWRLHRALIDLCGNPVYGLILNSFHDFYTRLARHYLDEPEMREEVRAFWHALYNAALAGQPDRGADLMRRHMLAIRRRWPQLDVAAWIHEPEEEEIEMDDG
jgi:GntR family negative regulator for fad regulon and positive regulator of fabA